MFIIHTKYIGSEYVKEPWPPLVSQLLCNVTESKVMKTDLTWEWKASANMQAAFIWSYGRQGSLNTSDESLLQHFFP